MVAQARRRCRRTACAATLIAACAPASAAVNVADVVADPDQTIRFDRHCATEQPYRMQAYGRFTARQAEAEVLALVIAGHAGPLAENPVIGAALQAIRLRGFADWADDPFSVALVVADGGRSVASAPAPGYHASTPGNPPRANAFRIDAAGGYDWLTLVEPDDRPKNLADARLHRLPPSLHVSHAHFPDTDWEAPLWLSLVVRNERSGADVTLLGAAVVAPARIMTSAAPRSRRLGLLATLNPFDEGGLFQWFRNAAKYRNCIDERRTAKRAFPGYPSGG